MDHSQVAGQEAPSCWLPALGSHWQRPFRLQLLFENDCSRKAVPFSEIMLKLNAAGRRDPSPPSTKAPPRLELWTQHFIHESGAGEPIKEHRHAPTDLADDLSDPGRERDDDFVECPRAGSICPLSPGPRMHSHHAGKLQCLLHARARAWLERFRQRATGRPR